MSPPYCPVFKLIISAKGTSPNKATSVPRSGLQCEFGRGTRFSPGQSPSKPWAWRRPERAPVAVGTLPPLGGALQGLRSISSDLFKDVTWGLFGLLYKRHLISSLSG